MASSKYSTNASPYPPFAYAIIMHTHTHTYIYPHNVEIFHARTPYMYFSSRGIGTAMAVRVYSIKALVQLSDAY